LQLFLKLGNCKRLIFNKVQQILLAISFEVLNKMKKYKYNPNDPVIDFKLEETESEQKSGPVTVLGRTFVNDNERRAYFREQLRAKLPELRSIEGFPIGSDDDIINLSDPPYYTACPNPWINDFIEEWEQEKRKLEADGERLPNIIINEPYSYPIEVGKNSSIYNAHSYHTKVPHEIIMRYILHYTQPGDIIVDNFAGTGMCGVAASQCENPDYKTRASLEQDFKENGLSAPRWGVRHAITGDLSPLCYHISSNYNDSCNTSKLNVVVKKIIDILNTEFHKFYKIETPYGKAHVNYYVWSEIVICKNCGGSLNVHDLSYEYNTGILHKDLICPICGAEQERKDAITNKETIYDDLLGKSIEEIVYRDCFVNVTTPENGRQFLKNYPKTNPTSINGFVPLQEFGNGDKYSDPKRVGATHVHHLYSPRTKAVLAYLYDLIHRQNQDLIKPLMFIFTSMLPKLTRLNRYMPQHGSRALVGPMANTLYIPPQYVENNPIDQFEYQAKKVIKALNDTKQCSVVEVCSATNTPIRAESVDYIFTDPPFGANIMYSELNSVSESWLKVKTDNSEEAISNKTQGKGFVEYQDIMTRCFEEYFRILKPDAWMTVEFSNTSAAFWNSLQSSIRAAGFVITTVTDLSKQRGGLHSMLGPTAVKQDLALSCYKPSSKLSQQLIYDESEKSVWDFVDELLNHTQIYSRKEGKLITILERTPKILYDRLVSFYVQHGLQVPIDAKNFHKELQERYTDRDGMLFTATQSVVYDNARKLSDGFQATLFFVDSEQSGIAWLNNELLKPQSYQDLFPKWTKATNGIRKGDILPELMQILHENFIKEPDGKWRVANMQDDVDLEALRLKALLKEFKAYVEIANKPKSKIKEARVEALRAGFKQAYRDKDFATIVKVGDRIPSNLLQEDEVLLQFYQIASSRV
jgi:DNA modification methylase